ncbi:MAG: hypothetical protein ACRC6X_08305 [Culicoidibacterales bacterium]
MMKKSFVILPDKSENAKKYVLTLNSPYLLASNKSKLQILKDTFSLKNCQYTCKSKSPCIYFISEEKISIYDEIKSFSPRKITLEIMQMELRNLIPTAEIQKAEYTGELINHNLRYLCLLLQLAGLIIAVYLLGTVEILTSPLEKIAGVVIVFLYLVYKERKQKNKDQS